MEQTAAVPLDVKTCPESEHPERVASKKPKSTSLTPEESSSGTPKVSLSTSPEHAASLPVKREEEKKEIATSPLFSSPLMD